MLNRTGITKTSATTPNQILFNVQMQASVPVMIAANTASVTEGMKKIAKAGTPISGNLRDRTTTFTTASDSAPAVGILLHDVDVTGTASANATLLIFGFVNLDRIDTATQALLTETRMSELKGSVHFLKDK